MATHGSRGPKTAAKNRQEPPPPWREAGHGARAGDRGAPRVTDDRRSAQRCGVGERTLQRWLADDQDFQQQYETARHVTFQAALHRVQTLMTRAVNVLDDLLAATRAPAVQLGAARTIVELGLHEHDAQAIRRKLNEIEQFQRSRRPW